MMQSSLYIYFFFPSLYQSLPLSLSISITYIDSMHFSATLLDLDHPACFVSRACLLFHGSNEILIYSFFKPKSNKFSYFLFASI